LLIFVNVSLLLSFRTIYPHMSGVENDIFARPPNLTMAFYDLDL